MVEADLIIIGGGPCGLSSAIKAASEGLSVVLLEGEDIAGGRARWSPMIENYPGFPDGISGRELSARLLDQAYKFGVQVFPHNRAIAYDSETGTILTEGFQEFKGKAILLALGLSWRPLPVPGAAQYIGRGVHYGMPEVWPTRQCDIIVVGGANSAGQAAMRAAKVANTNVHMLVRGRVTGEMSRSLLDKVEAQPNISIKEGYTVEEVLGNARLHAVRVKGPDGVKEIPAAHLLIFIGAAPHTAWLAPYAIRLCPERYVVTGEKAGSAYAHGTSVRGIFAAGDVRSGSSKSIAASVGEGYAAISEIFSYITGDA